MLRAGGDPEKAPKREPQPGIQGEGGGGHGERRTIIALPSFVASASAHMGKARFGKRRRQTWLAPRRVTRVIAGPRAARISRLQGPEPGPCLTVSCHTHVSQSRETGVTPRTRSQRHFYYQ